jgi:hypothetical protein
MPQQVATNGPVRYMQGIAVPAESVRPAEFFARTRRHIGLEKAATWAGVGGQDVVELKKSDVLGGLTIRFTGTLVVTPVRHRGDDRALAVRPDPAGPVHRERRLEPHQRLGLKLKVREFQVRQDLDDRGVPQTIGGATKTQGTLSKSSESWGVGSAPPSIRRHVRGRPGPGSCPSRRTRSTSPARSSRDLDDLTLTIDWEQTPRTSSP